MTQWLLIDIVKAWRQNHYHTSQQLLHQVAIYGVAQSTRIIRFNWADGKFRVDYLPLSRHL